LKYEVAAPLGFAVGLASLIAGVAMLSVPAALIVGGVAFIVTAIAWERGRET
jgi:hypothetical protein